MFSLFLTSAKSNDIINTVLSCSENCVDFLIYDVIMSPEHFEIKNKDLRPL